MSARRSAVAQFFWRMEGPGSALRILACRRAGDMPGLWRLVAASGTSQGGQAYGHAAAELAAQGGGHLGPGRAGMHHWHCNAELRHVSSLTQYRKNRKINDAQDERCHRINGCGWAKRKSRDLPLPAG